MHLRLTSFQWRSGWAGKALLAVCVAGCLSASASAQIILRADSVRVYFPSGKANFDPDFQDNGAAIDAFIQTARSAWNAREEVEVEQVIINSSSSPEGSDALNRQLSQKRRESILQYLRSRLKIKSDDNEYSSHITDWPLLRRLVEEDGAMPAEYREAALEKLTSDTPSSLKQLQGTPAWKYLLENIFPQMRTTMVVFVWETWAEPELPELALEDNALEWPDVVFPDFQPLDDNYAVKAAKKRPSTRDIVVKVNMLTLPALVANAGIEIVLALAGFMVLAFFFHHPDMMASGSDLCAQADTLFPRFIRVGLPTGLTGLIAAAIMAAAMSSLSSGLNSSATVILEDLVKPYAKRRVSDEKRDLRAVKLISALLGVVVTFSALSVALVPGNLIDLMMKVVNLVVAPLFVLFFLALFVKGATDRGTILAGLFSFGVAIAIAFFEIFGIKSLWIMPISFIAGVLGGVFFCFIGRRIRK